MKMRYVEVFHAVMETGSMSAAGRLLHMTQPAVSRVIANVEAALGYPLFQRVGGRLAPTMEATLLFEASSALFEKMQAFKRAAAQLRGGEQGKLSLAALPAICHRLLPRVLRAFRRDHPDVVCEIHTLHKRQIVDDVISGAADIGFDFFGISHTEVESRVLGAGPLYLLAPARGRRHVLPADVDDEAARTYMNRAPMIGLVDNDPVAITFSRYCERHGVVPATRTLVHTGELAEDLVAMGMGWTVADFVSAGTCGPDVRAFALKPDIVCTLNSFTVKGRVPSPLARKFSALMHAELRTFADGAHARAPAGGDAPGGRAS